MLQLKGFSQYFEGVRIENDYFHIEIMISATEMLGGSGHAPRENFEMIYAIW